MVKAGHNVVCLVPDDQFIAELKLIGASTFVVRTLPYNLFSYGLIGFIISFYRNIIQIKPDIVLLFTPQVNIIGGALCKMSGIKYVINVSGRGYMNGRSGVLKLIFFFLEKMYNCILRSAFHVFVQNSEDEIHFRKILKDDSVKRLSRLNGSGVDFRKFSFREMPCTDIFTFGLFCRILKSKGVEVFIEAARIAYQANKNIKFYLGGPMIDGHPDGLSQDQLFRLLPGSGVEYVGSVSDIRPYINLCHFVVLPTRYREGMPKILLEAAAVGRGIITSDCAGAKETIIEHETGFLLRTHSPVELAQVMLEAASLSEAEVVEIGRNARNYGYKMFNDEISVQAYLNLLKKSLLNK